MFNNFTAKVRKWAGLPFEDVRNLLTWLDLNKSTFEIHNPNVLIAKATNERGEAVFYTTAEPILLVNAYAIAPGTSQEEAGDAAEAADEALVHEAERAGISRVLVVLPDKLPTRPDEKWIRVCERKIAQTTTVHIDGKPTEKKFIVNPQTQSAEWVN